MKKRGISNFTEVIIVLILVLIIAFFVFMAINKKLGLFEALA